MRSGSQLTARRKRETHAGPRPRRRRRRLTPPQDPRPPPPHRRPVGGCGARAAPPPPRSSPLLTPSLIISSALVRKGFSLQGAQDAGSMGGGPYDAAKMLAVADGLLAALRHACADLAGPARARHVS